MTDLATAHEAAKESGDDIVDPTDETGSDETDASTEVSDETSEPAGDGDSDVDPVETDAAAEADAEVEPDAEAVELEPDAEAFEADPEAEADVVDADAEADVVDADAGEEPGGGEPADEADPLDEEPAEEEPADEEPAEETVPADDALTEVVPAGVAIAEPAAEALAAPVPDEIAGQSPATTAPDGGGHDAPVLAWAPAEPKPRKRRTGLWIGLGAGAAAAALVASSLVLIAPGTSVAGVTIGGMTPGGAADAIQQRLAQTTVVLTVDGTDVELTGAELGALVDARALADAAFAEHPMWNPTTWFASAADADVALDADAATETLRAALPDLYTDPVDASIAFDPATAAYVVTPAETGTGIDVATVEDALQEAFERGSTRVEVAIAPSDVEAAIPTPVADETAAGLNGMLDVAGFYIGDERTVPVDRAVAASWLSVTPDGDGFVIAADAAAIQPLVDGLAAAVDRPAQDARVITNSAGTVLREEAVGQSGRELGDTSDIAAEFAALLAAGDATFDLPVTEVPLKTVALARTIDVNLSQQRAHLFENGNLVGSYVISSGLAGTPTPTGNFTVNGYSRIQSMGCFEGAEYCVEDVPWVTWFAPDIGFHGANNLRSSLGFPQSHGCVNMWDDAAKLVYDWTAMGTEVSVHW